METVLCEAVPERPHPPLDLHRQAGDGGNREMKSHQRFRQKQSEMRGERSSREGGAARDTQSRDGVTTPYTKYSVWISLEMWAMVTAPCSTG